MHRPLAAGRAGSGFGPGAGPGAAAGANQIQGISFQIADDQPYRLMALQQAGGRARAKAAAIAAGLGVTLGDVDAAAESTQTTPVYAAPALAVGGAPSTPVLPG